jgi:hypothetical protein
VTREKTPLFISGVLTTFVLIMMAGVLTSFRTVSAEAQPAPASEPTEVPATATAAPQVVSAEVAAQIAAKMLNQTDVYSVETAALDGVDVYKVTLSSGDVVYVSPTGEVIQVVPAPSSVHRSAPSGGSSSQYESESHSEDDEHEEHEEYDD